MKKTNGVYCKYFQKSRGDKASARNRLRPPLYVSLVHQVSFSFLLARRVFTVICFNFLGINICHEELVIPSNGQSHENSMRRCHGKALEGGHASIVPTDSRGRNAGQWARSVHPFVVVDDSVRRQHLFSLQKEKVTHTQQM